MIELENLVPIGQVAVFYLPASKLGVNSRHWRRLEAYFREHHFGYTFQGGTIYGYWMEEHGNFLREENLRFEVSFGGGEDTVKTFVAFLSDLCRQMEEDAIYLTMGYKSYLVMPRKAEDEN